ncbi:unnamed protein product [Allacma fusca]|uniref:DUF7869 domain-containing protein n=1 Tax=Allacma fusca TaxID=39272 RepID=A0A8J2PUI4_9HEXA|nr:unnamed protein product [Allacma fusca]
MFVYSEHFAKKGANEVLTCLIWYITNIVPGTCTHLHIYCDNTYGQNKNRYLFAVLQNLANNRFTNVCVHYPVPGHSRMPIDGDFGRITCKSNMCEKMSYPSDVVHVIQNAQKEKPFNIVYVNNNLTDDLCDDGRVVLDVKDFKSALESLLLTTQKANLNLQNTRELLFRPHQSLTLNFSERFDHNKRELSLFKTNVSADNLSEALNTARSAYDDFLPISAIKLRNVEELTKYVVQKPNLNFYSTLYTEVDGLRKYFNA